MPFLKVKTLEKFLLEIVITIFIILFTGLGAFSQTLFGPEYQVKAGFIYNFTKFVEWPVGTFENKNDSVSLCIVSNNPDSDVFLSLNDKKVGANKIRVRKCNGIEDIEGCHILFIDSKDKKLIQKSLKAVKGKSVLTIGHSKGFAREGGIINFFTEEDRLRFEVNLDAAKSSRLKLGSQILMSAEIITQE